MSTNDGGDAGSGGGGRLLTDRTLIRIFTGVFIVASAAVAAIVALTT